jgi:hypothetical protein
MPAATTDVREWLRSQGHTVGDRGNISRELREEYYRAHDGDTVNAAPDGSYDITTAREPSPATDTRDEDYGPQEPDEDRTGASRERPPRAVKGKRRPAAGQLREKLFPRGKGRRRGPRQPRVSLADFAEDTWTDLAWLAQPFPPLARILTIQAPYAGVVLDEEVKGTPVDSVLQPLARMHGAYRALSGLVGPPLWTAAICAGGARVQVTDRDGKLVLDERGQPVTDYDGRTKMMFMGLRYSLLQMVKTGNVQQDRISERTETMQISMVLVDKMIADIFSMPGMPQPPGPPPPPQQERAAGNGYVHTFTYPGEPGMDESGADPGRG